MNTRGPSGGEVTLLRPLGEDHLLLDLLRVNQEYHRASAADLNAPLQIFRVVDLECRPIKPASGAGWRHENLAHFKTVLTREHAIEKFRTKLIKSVTAEIVGRHSREKAPPNTEGIHRVAKGDGHVEHVFQCAAVDNSIIFLEQMRW